MNPAAPPPHAPDGGLMRRLLGPFYVTGVFWFRFHRWGVTVVPEWGIKLCIALFTTFFFVALRRIRKAIAGNLEAVLGPCSWWQRQARIYRTMWNFAWCLSERYENLSTKKRVSTQVIGEDIWQRAVKEPAGLIFVTAHIGHWEVGSMLVPGRHIHVVREAEMDPQAQAFVRKLLNESSPLGTESGFTMHFADKDPSLGPRLLKALRHGDFVAVQGDRPRSTGRCYEVELFGRPLRLPAGPVALARAARVDMLPVFVFRRRRLESHVVLRPPIRVEGQDEQGLREAVRRIASEVEWAIRQSPYQWFCFRELWP